MPKTTKFADIIPVYVLAFLVVVAGYVTCSGAVQNQIAKLAVRRAYRGYSLTGILVAEWMHGRFKRKVPSARRHQRIGHFLCSRSG